MSGAGQHRRLVLFDIDGTLVLTGRAGLRAMIRTFAEMFGATDAFAGIPVAGRTDQAIFTDAVARLGLKSEPEMLETFRRRYCDLLSTEILQPGPRKGVMPGVELLLDVLAARDHVTLALLTGNFAEAARIKLEFFGLWRYFVSGAFGDDAEDRNALVAVALRRVREAGRPRFDPAHVFVVGDTPLDIAAAQAAGARSVGVATGDYDPDSLSASGADAVFADLSDTEAFLRLLE
jgi:phosphoglycolate phosphatase-like HAD superfamily hydrolase